MIEFRSGIIKGKILDGKLIVSIENPNFSTETYYVKENDIEEFLKRNGYMYSKSKKTGAINFSKCFMENKLKEYLSSRGITQSYLAKKLGVKKTFINNLCNAQNLELDTAYKILAALGLKPEDISFIFPPKNFEMFL